MTNKAGKLITMDNFHIEQARKEMQPWNWWGIPTFFKCLWDENDVGVQHIESYFKTIDAAGARPVSVGGDHAITGPTLKTSAGKNAKTTGAGKTALLHFDAHRDSSTSTSPTGWAADVPPRIGRTTPWFEEHVDPERSVQIRLRGNPIRPREDVNHSILCYKPHHGR